MACLSQQVENSLCILKAKPFQAFQYDGLISRFEAMAHREGRFWNTKDVAQHADDGLVGLAFSGLSGYT